MADETENAQVPATVGELETRIAALETRLNQIESRLTRRVTDIEQIPITSLTHRLSRLESRHENLLRHTPDAREEPNYLGTAFAIIVVIVCMLLVLH